MSVLTVSGVIEQLRVRAGVSVTRLGPLVEMSPAWGQRILDGTICPDLDACDQLARALGAREPERLALLEAASRVKLARVGITGEDLDKVVEVLLVVYRERKQT